LTETRLKIAVFIDFDNIEIGVKTTLGQPFDIAAILEGIKERGEVVTKVAYGDWKRAGDHGRLLSQHAIRMVQRNLTPGGDKNGADINLALDALEMAFTHDHINAFVIVGGDSDFITLVEKLKQYDKKVFVVGGRQFTSLVMQKNCHEFIAYENLVGGRRSASVERKGGAPATPAATDVAKAIPLVKRALKVLVDREVSPQLGLLKSTLLQLDSTFSERDYGASTFRDFIEKVAQTGLVTLRHAGRSLLVELAETNGGEAAAAVAPTEAPVEARPQPAPEPAAPEPVAVETRETAPAAPPDSARAHEATQHVLEIFQRAPQPPRWPMYVRQVKQYLRAADDGFDERKWGFATIVEFLRAGQRDGVFRLERDRQGVLRVFPGASLQRPAATADASPEATTATTPVLPLEGEATVTGDAGPDSERLPPVTSDLDVVAAAATPGGDGQDAAADRSEPDAAFAGETETTVARPSRGRRPARKATPGKPAARKSTGVRTAASRAPRAPRARKKVVEG
jgi:uncharacterized LabA/DUF88 family protein